MQRAGKIFYEANANCLTSSATFSAARSCTEQKATQLYGSTVATSVSQAWAAVGVGSAPNPGPGTEIIIDNDNANNVTSQYYSQISTSWALASAATGLYKNNYHYASTQAVSDGAAFYFYLSAPATRTVEAWWTAGTNRSATAPFIVYDASGTQLGSVSVNQQLNGSQWNALGTFNFTAGWNRVVLSRWTTTGYVVIADAVRIR